MTRTETRDDDDIAPARFKASDRIVVVTDDGDVAQPGDDRIGMLGVGGAIPLGYYKDDEKTAATFRTVAGRRYSIPGDYATVEADGTIRLLGRGSACINTGGEKVYPEEVELDAAGAPGRIRLRRRRHARRSLGRDGRRPRRSATGVPIGEDSAHRALPRHARGVQGAQAVPRVRVARTITGGQGRLQAAARARSRCTGVTGVMP